MNQEKRAILIIGSRLLGYPTENFHEMLDDFDELIDDVVKEESNKNELKTTYQNFRTFNLTKLQELYVENFDLKSKLGLYLTSHELGDSNKRGAALIRLQKIINQAGFERVGEELVDYIPMLLEFIAISPEKPEVERLYKRLGVAIHYMKENIEKDNPYATILHVLMKYVFLTPTNEEMKQLEAGREEADLEELPYPIMYK